MTGPAEALLATGGLLLAYALVRFLRYTAHDRGLRRIADRCEAAIELVFGAGPHAQTAGLRRLDRIGAEAAFTRQLVIDSVCRFLRSEPADPHPDSPYAAAMDILLRRTRPGRAHWPNLDIDLRDAVLVDFAFAEAHVRRATFERTRFVGRVDLRDTRFDGYALFADCAFTSHLDAEGAVFADDAAFDGAAFRASTAFSGATFARDALFSGARFRGPAQFLWVEVGGNARFDGAVFGRGAQFRQARFAGRATFAGARFVGVADFRQVGFASGIEVSLADFSGSATFDDAVAPTELFRSSLEQIGARTLLTPIALVSASRNRALAERPEEGA